MSLEERTAENAFRRWQYLPVRIETNSGRLAAYEAELARLMAEPRRDYKRVHCLRSQIASTRARIKKLHAAKAAR